MAFAFQQPRTTGEIAKALSEREKAYTGEQYKIYDDSKPAKTELEDAKKEKAETVKQKKASDDSEEMKENSLQPVPAGFISLPTDKFEACGKSIFKTSLNNPLEVKKCLLVVLRNPEDKKKITNEEFVKKLEKAIEKKKSIKIELNDLLTIIKFL